MLMVFHRNKILYKFQECNILVSRYLPNCVSAQSYRYRYSAFGCSVKGSISLWYKMIPILSKVFNMGVSCKKTRIQNSRFYSFVGDHMKGKRGAMN
jgi:hypothetical protein